MGTSRLAAVVFGSSVVIRSASDWLLTFAALDSKLARGIEPRTLACMRRRSSKASTRSLIAGLAVFVKRAGDVKRLRILRKLFMVRPFYKGVVVFLTSPSCTEGVTPRCAG